MKFFLALLVLVAGMVLYIRVAPSEPDKWHVDPLAAGDPGRSGYLQQPGPGTKTYPMTPEALMAAFDAVAMAAPRVQRLAGSVDGRHVTYIARSRLMRFPDYVSVRAVAAEGGAQLAIYARQWFGAGDQGVNRARTESWLDRLDRLGVAAG